MGDVTDRFTANNFYTSTVHSMVVQLFKFPSNNQTCNVTIDTFQTNNNIITAYVYAPQSISVTIVP